jgi:hypothetical protein
MMQKQNFTIKQGDTFRKLVRWEQLPYIYKAISGITNTAPVRITVAGTHGLTDGWRAAVVSVIGMDEINAPHSPPYDTDMQPVTVVDPNHVELNAVNAAEYSPYKSGGYLQFYTPVDLTGYTARMQIRDPVTEELLCDLSTEDGRIVINPAAKTIALTIPADIVQAFDWTRGVYDLEMISVLGVRETIFTGSITVKQDIEYT